jgi:hypothetical protein
VRNDQKDCDMHKRMYDIDGCLGNLDVTKIHWAACLPGWKGQFEGKEGYSIIGLEAVVDHHLCGTVLLGLLAH